MKELVESFKKLDWIIKLILCIPAIEIVVGVVRVIDGVCKNDLFKIIISILLIIPGAFGMWIVDLIWVLVYKRHFWL
jgi:hypothetical protein